MYATLLPPSFVPNYSKEVTQGRASYQCREFINIQRTPISYRMLVNRVVLKMVYRQFTDGLQINTTRVCFRILGSEHLQPVIVAYQPWIIKHLLRGFNLFCETTWCSLWPYTSDQSLVPAGWILVNWFFVFTHVHSLYSYRQVIDIQYIFIEIRLQMFSVYSYSLGNSKLLFQYLLGKSNVCSLLCNLLCLTV